MTLKRQRQNVKKVKKKFGYDSYEIFQQKS